MTPEEWEEMQASAREQLQKLPQQQRDTLNARYADRDEYARYDPADQPIRYDAPEPKE